MEEEITITEEECASAVMGQNWLDDPRAQRHAALSLAHDPKLPAAAVVERAQHYLTFLESKGGPK